MTKSLTAISTALLTALLLLARPAPTTADEPVIGGPCEGCELVFVGMPENPTSHARIAPLDEPGEPLHIEGVVRTPDGEPAPGIIVYAYQTDATGIYPEAPTRHGRLRGWARTDGAGRYDFDTIRPGAYPGRTIPQHIHMHVIEPGRATYWIASIHFSDDPLLTSEDRERLESGRGGSGLVDPKRNSAGAWVVRRDIVLGLGVPD
jgi:protocatechuate 3,4-dioxygenase beta subunit